MSDSKYKSKTLEVAYEVKGKDKTRLEQIVQQAQNRSANEE